MVNTTYLTTLEDPKLLSNFDNTHSLLLRHYLIRIMYLYFCWDSITNRESQHLFPLQGMNY